MDPGHQLGTLIAASAKPSKARRASAAAVATIVGRGGGGGAAISTNPNEDPVSPSDHSEGPDDVIHGRVIHHWL